MRPYFSASSSPLPRTDRLAALTSAWARTCPSAGLAASDGAVREIGGGRMRARVGSRTIGGSIDVGASPGNGALVVVSNAALPHVFGFSENGMTSGLDRVWS